MTIQHTKLPKKGRGRKEILRELGSLSKDDPDYKNLKTWSLVYYLGEEHTDFLLESYGRFFSANGLNPMAFKSLKKMEQDVIRITAELLHGDENVTGIMTSCGTESCMSAVKTYREMGRIKRKIKKPNMILPETAHVSWFKGAEYFNVQAIKAPLDKNYCADVKKAEKLINKNTIMILGSAPEYPHGIIDPIEELGKIAQKHDIPLHVDACLGGYLLPFLEMNGAKLPLWDYRIPGVTSISADTHKYGYAAKGASTITYRSIDILKHQFFVYENWPGGVFASPGFLGTRPGGSYAAAWATLQVLGEEEYRKLTAKVMKATEELITGINEIPELEIIGNPLTSVFAYRSNSKSVNIFSVGDQMESRNWHIDRLQRPEALHAMVTPLHGNVAITYLKDLRDSVKFVKKHPELAISGSAATYNMIANIPLRGMVKKNVGKMFAQMYTPGNETMDIAKVSVNKTEGEDNRRKLSENLAIIYLKIKAKLKGSGLA